MKSYTIYVDETIWSYLKTNAEPFEDTPNSVLHRLLFDGRTPFDRMAQFDELILGLPGKSKKIPQALSQILEVLFEIRRMGRSRSDATAIVARRRSRAPQTIIDKYCRQLGKKTQEIDSLLEEDNLETFKRLLETRFKKHKDIIVSFFKQLDAHVQKPVDALSLADRALKNRSQDIKEYRNNSQGIKPVEIEIPTYDDLTQQVNRLKETVSESEDSEIKFKTLFENANDLIAFIDRRGVVYEVNDKCESFFGLKREGMIGKKFSEFADLFLEKMQDLVEDFNEIFAKGKSIQMHEQTIQRKDGTIVHAEVSSNFVEKDGKKIGIITVWRDITDRKLAEENLRRYRDHLAELVKERTAELEKSNSALRIMLQKESEVKKEFEERLIFNVKKLILPNLERLSRSPLSETQKNYLTVIESNLDEIISSFYHDIFSKHFDLTPTELQIADFIMHGKSTKEIAEFLSLSVNTIQFHRANIRTKLKITNKKINLRTFLHSLQK